MIRVSYKLSIECVIKLRLGRDVRIRIVLYIFDNAFQWSHRSYERELKTVNTIA